MSDIHTLPSLDRSPLAFLALKINSGRGGGVDQLFLITKKGQVDLEQ